MSKPTCIFCKIVNSEIPSAKVYEDPDFIAIRDIQPQAKTHLLVIPKAHFDHLDSPGAESVTVKIIAVANEVARLEGLTAHGYRVVVNTREWGGQTVAHLHMHVLGGEQLRGRFA
ncbi:MAG: histidine triad nucleotide-binding protein [Bdellovibrionales bacterium]|nr:histidine triad nucleotide-binding protein [Bdellovibrionales bacterium]